MAEWQFKPFYALLAYEQFFPTLFIYKEVLLFFLQWQRSEIYKLAYFLRVTCYCLFIMKPLRGPFFVEFIHRSSFVYNLFLLLLICKVVILSHQYFPEECDLIIQELYGEIS